MNETETLSTTKTGISLEELSATPEWRGLGANLKRLLTLALQSRNLFAAIHETRPTLDAEMQREIAEKLIREPDVQAVVNLYSLGVAAAPQSAPVQPKVPATQAEAAAPALAESI